VTDMLRVYHQSGGKSCHLSRIERCNLSREKITTLVAAKRG
jgi:hypothetical protein